MTSYQAAGPYDVASLQGIYPPPTYQVNGGGPDSGLSPPELASLESAKNFDGLLLANGVAHHLCKVDSTQHATHLLPLYCDDDPSGNTVRWHVVDWLGNNGICSDPLHPCIDLP